MNLFHLSVWLFAQALVLRLSFLFGIWESHLLRCWDESCDGARHTGEPVSLRAFIRARLAVWRITVCWGHCPWLSWRERAAHARVQFCLLLLTLGVRVPLVVLGLEHPLLQHWSGWPAGQERMNRWKRLLWVVSWPARQEQRASARLTHQMTALVGDEAMLRRVTLASLYPGVDAVPNRVQSGELVHALPQSKGDRDDSTVHF